MDIIERRYGQIHSSLQKQIKNSMYIYMYAFICIYVYMYLYIQPTCIVLMLRAFRRAKLRVLCSGAPCSCEICG